MRTAGEEEDRKKRTRDRGGWKRLTDEAVKKLRAAPHPSLTKGKEDEKERGRLAAASQRMAGIYKRQGDKRIGVHYHGICLLCVAGENLRASC